MLCPPLASPPLQHPTVTVSACGRFFALCTPLAIKRRVGSGGFADVYEAREKGTGRQIALKRFKTLEVSPDARLGCDG